MGFFAEFDAWLTATLAGYIAANTAKVAAAMEPAFLTLGTVYVMVWGYLQLTGQIEEPFTAGLKRIVTLVVIFAVALRLWLYNDVIVDSVFRAPAELAARILGVYDPVALIDQIFALGSDTASLLFEKAGFFDGDPTYYLAGFAVYLIVDLTALYTIFLLSLSKIALSVLLALGPLFIGLTLFSTTKRFFESWCAQLANYALVTVLTVLTAALMLQLLSVAATQAAAAGDGIQIALAVRVCLAAGLVFLVMRQVMPMSAGLASGIALSTFGAVSALTAWGLGRAGRTASDFTRGFALDRETTRWDSLSRKAGYYLRHGATAGLSRIASRRDANVIEQR